MLPSPTLIAVALRVPANAVLAPVNVAAVVEPDLIIKLPELFVNAHTVCHHLLVVHQHHLHQV